MLDNFFNVDNPLFRFLNRIIDLFVLNIVFIITCLPVFTIGAALTALNYTAISAIQREDGYVVKLYFKSFTSNFKQSTLIWLIMLPIGAILGADVYFWVSQWTNNGTWYSRPMIVVSVVLLAVYFFMLIMIFPIQSKFDNKVSATFRNSFLLVINHFPKVLLLAFTILLFAFFVFMYPLGKVIAALFGFSIMAYLHAFVYKSIFKRYMPEKKSTSDEDFSIDNNDDSSDEDND